MTWILLILMSAGGVPSLDHIDGFPSKESCEEARKEVLGSFAMWDVRTGAECIAKKSAAS